MKKIISLFQRNYEGDRLVRDEVVPGAEWVQAGDGVATRKWDGTCCMVKDGKLFKRYEVKPGKQPPADFIAANEVDENTGKQQGWRPVGDGPEDKYHREAWSGDAPRDGTYELLGPMVNANPEQVPVHVLIPHGQHVIKDAPRTFDALREYFKTHDIEGIVWWNIDGRMVKIKGKDFGISRLVPRLIIKDRGSRHERDIHDHSRRMAGPSRSSRERRHIEALRRRIAHLEKRVETSPNDLSFDRAELGALRWVLRYVFLNAKPDGV